VVSRAQGEYEQLEKEKEKDGKRELDDGGLEDGGRESKRAKGMTDGDGDDEEMEIEMEDDEDGESTFTRRQSMS